MKHYAVTQETVEMNLTPVQERAIERAIIKICDSDRAQGAHRLVTLELEQQSYGPVSIYLVTDNNKPGSLGHCFKNYHHLFVGRRGGYSTYKDGKKITGINALIWA